MSMAEIKTEQRNALHAEMAEPCLYTDRATPVTPSVEQSAEGLLLSARFKFKLKVGSAEADGVSILENVESLIFNQPQLDALELELDHNAVIEFPGYGISFVLDQRMDPDGPVNVYWTVTRTE
jgi:hypothetical protein